MSPLIDLQSVSKRYGTNWAVRDLSLQIPPGELFACLGPNGAGKTTTIKMITGLLRPTAGRVFVAGQDMASNSLEARRCLSYVPDEPHLYEKLSGREFLQFTREIYGLSGLRCGWVLAPPPLARRMWRINDLHGAIPAHAAERLAVVALDHLPAIAAAARALLARNRALLAAFLDTRRDLETVRPEAGTIVFPRLAGGEVEALCRLLRERHETSVVPGAFFESPGHFRLGIGGETEMVEEGLARLARALDEL